MKEVSLFDVIGPVMVGPSSSHTAGAVRLGNFIRNVFNAEIKQASFTLYGSFSKTYRGHGTDYALLGGVLGFDTSDERIVHSFQIAKEEGVEFSFLPSNETLEDMHPNTVKMTLENDNKKMTVVGESIGGGGIRIRSIDDLAVDVSGEYLTLIIRYKDTPGMISRFTQVLSDKKINIAKMMVFRENKGEKAYAIIETDEKVSDDSIEEIEQMANIYNIFQIVF